jgi:protein ImuB
MLLWLYLDFPSLQLDSLFTNEEASSHPVIIVDGRRHTVVQANDIAQQHGITLNMGLGSAAALCPDLQVYPIDETVTKQRLTDIAQWLYLLTSDITLDFPQGLIIKVSNMLSLYQGLENYWQSLNSHLATLKVNVQYATGLSPFAAKLLAKSKANLIEDDSHVLKQSILPYPLQQTELSDKQVDTLNRVGIRTIEDLLALPLADIAKRFDIDLVNYVGRLTGYFKHPVDAFIPPEQFQSYLELLFDIDNVQWLEKPLARLFNQLEIFLKLRDRVAYELTLTIDQRDHESKSIRFTSAQGDYRAKTWQLLSALTLESVSLEGAAYGLTLAVTRWGELQPSEQDFFQGIKGQQSALELTSLLQAKLGTQAVMSVQLTDDPRPEKATRLHTTPPTTSDSATSVQPQKIRPSFLLPEPIPLTEKSTIVLGPERIVSGWWDGDAIQRDYFIARTCQGQWLWVFRTQESQWFVHGHFS